MVCSVQSTRKIVFCKPFPPLWSKVLFFIPVGFASKCNRRGKIYHRSQFCDQNVNDTWEVAKNGRQIEKIYFWSHPKIVNNRKNGRMKIEKRTTTTIWIKLRFWCLKLSLVMFFDSSSFWTEQKNWLFYLAMSHHTKFLPCVLLHRSKFIKTQNQA